MFVIVNRFFYAVGAQFQRSTYDISRSNGIILIHSIQCNYSWQMVIMTNYKFTCWWTLWSFSFPSSKFYHIIWINVFFCRISKYIYLWFKEKSNKTWPFQSEFIKLVLCHIKFIIRVTHNHANMNDHCPRYSHPPIPFSKINIKTCNYLNINIKYSIPFEADIHILCLLTLNLPINYQIICQPFKTRNWRTDRLANIKCERMGEN